MKYKMIITGSAEMLFTLMSKLLPDELEIEVEEIVGKPDPNVARIAKVEQFVARKPKKKLTGSRHTISFDPTKGINGILLGLLNDGHTHRAVEFRPLLRQAGYSESSVTSRIENLHRRKLVHKVGNGLWQIVKPEGITNEAS